MMVPAFFLSFSFSSLVSFFFFFSTFKAYSLRFCEILCCLSFELGHLTNQITVHKYFAFVFLCTEFFFSYVLTQINIFRISFDPKNCYWVRLGLIFQLCYHVLTHLGMWNFAEDSVYKIYFLFLTPQCTYLLEYIISSVFKWNITIASIS